MHYDQGPLILLDNLLYTHEAAVSKKREFYFTGQPQ